MTPFFTVILIFLAVSAVVAAICMVPLDLFLAGGRRGSAGFIEGFIAFGIFGIGFSNSEKPANPVIRKGRVIFMTGVPKTGEPPVPSPSGEPHPPADFRRGFQVARSFLSLLPSLFQFLSRVSRHLRIRRIAGELKIGFRNPADTGILFGYYCAVSPVLLISNRIGFQLIPVFDRETLEGEVELEIRLHYPISVFAGGAKFFADPNNRDFFRTITSAGIR